jgi:hypothetical protein
VVQVVVPQAQKTSVPGLSLSRLNHRLPGDETHPEVVQGAAAFHHQIADALLPETEPIFDDTTTRDTAVDRLDAPPTLGQRLIGSLLCPCQLRAAGVLRGPEALHVGQRDGQATQSLPEPAPGRPGLRRGVPTELIMGAAARRVTETKDEAQRLDSQAILHGVSVVLAAGTLLLVSRVLGADEASFRPGMGTRGASGMATGAGTTGAGSSAKEPMTGAAATSETPRRWARARRARAGAAPRGRRAGRSPGRRPWSHCWAFLCRLPHRRPCTPWEGVGLQRREEEEQPSCRRPEGAVVVHAPRAGGPGFPIEAPRRHRRLERCCAGRDQELQRVKGQAGAIQALWGAILHVGEPSMRHRWCRLLYLLYVST